MVDIAVSEAARRLKLDESRVRQLLRSGSLAGRLVGSRWLVDAVDVARLTGQVRRGGRPLAPARAWALLDLLAGGSAEWLKPAARSQVRAVLRSLAAGADGDRWRALLAARSSVHRCWAHPAAIERLVREPRVLVGGPQRAVRAGLDLVVVDGGLSDLYVAAELWPSLAARYRVRDRASQPNLLVRVPQGMWPFAEEVSPEALAADLLDSAESRAVDAAATFLNAGGARALAGGR